MMPRYATTLAASLLVLAAQAQISIGLAEMPQAGDQLTRVRAFTNPFLNYAATGAAHTWSFTNLQANTGDTARYQSVASTNFLYAIVYADLPFNPNRANHAKQGVDVPFSNLLPISNPYTFRRRSSSQYKTVGFGLELNGLPVPVVFDEHDVIYQLPLQFGATSTSHSSWHIDVPNLGYYGFEQTRENVVDGWGAITTPAGSFDVLRVKTTLTARDSIAGVVINRPVAREYKWLAQGLRVPVLQINTAIVIGMEVITDVWFYDVPRSLTVAQPLATTACPGGAITVPYTATGAFNSGGIIIPANQFVAQLSDASGSFANPVAIGSVQSSASGSINATIPAGTPPGSGYRIRVVSTSPSFTGAPSATSIAVGAPPVASITASAPPQLCTGESLVLTAVGGPGYQWRIDGAEIPGATGATLEVSSAGAYTVSVSNACGSALSNAIAITVSDPPQLSVAANSAVICAGSTALISANDLTGAPGTTYQWLLNQAPIAGADGLSWDAALAGEYTLVATIGATGCSSTSEVIMASIEQVDAPQLEALGSTSFCEGGSVELSASSPQAVAYAWSHDGSAIAGADGPLLLADAAGEYAVRAISTNGCASTPAALQVVVHALPAAPTVGATGATAFCAGGAVELTADAGGAALHWLADGSPIDGATDTLLIVTESGAYQAMATSAEGCASTPSAALTVTVHANPTAPTITAIEPTTFCAGGSATLIAEAIDGVSYQWLHDGAPIAGATGEQFTALDPGLYAVLVSTAEGCTTVSDTAIVVVVQDAPPQPVISQGLDGLEASGSGSFQWFLDGQPIPGATSASYEPTVNGTYTVQATDANGCSSLSEGWFFLTTGMGSHAEAVLRALPNPTTGALIVEAPAYAQRFEVLDITGQRVLSGRLASPRQAIDLSSAAEGAYFLRVEGAGKQHVLRVVVAR